MLSDDELDAIERRWNLVTGEWLESEGSRTAPEVGPLVWQDMPRLISELRAAREKLKAAFEVVSEWREFAKGVGTYGDILTMADDLEAALRGGDV